jgi:hypothetical protein
MQINSRTTFAKSNHYEWTWLIWTSSWKTVDNDTLSFYLENSDLNRLAIKVENSEEDTPCTSLNMLEIEQSHLDIRKMNVQTCGILNSSEFSAIVKKMSTLSERVEIQYTDENSFWNESVIRSARKPLSAT